MWVLETKLPLCCSGSCSPPPPNTQHTHNQGCLASVFTLVKNDLKNSRMHFYFLLRSNIIDFQIKWPGHVPWFFFFSSCCPFIMLTPSFPWWDLLEVLCSQMLSVCLCVCLMKLCTLQIIQMLFLQYAYLLVYLGRLMDVIYMRVQWCNGLAWGVWHPARARSRLWWPLYLQDYLLMSDVGAGGLCASVDPSASPAVPSSVCISDVGPL